MSYNKRPLSALIFPDSGTSAKKRPKLPVPPVTPIDIGTNPNHSPSLPHHTPAKPDDKWYSQTHGKLNIAGNVLLSTLKSSLTLLQRSSGVVFPHLGSSVAGLLEALEAIETATSNSREVKELASQLPQWAVALEGHISGPQPEQMIKRVGRLVDVLREQTEYIRTQQKRGNLKRLTGSQKELEELEWCHRRIDAAFSQIQIDASLSVWRNTDEQIKDTRLNALLPAHDARYDSSLSDKVERGECLQNTRVTVLEAARRWIYCPGEARIYWVNGMAGTGKTTIAYSICTKLEQNERLGASFFCSRASPECRDVSRILPTIAYQLAQQSEPFRCALTRILGKEPNVGQRKLSVQFEYLIKNPLVEIKQTLPKGLVIVIDALDECSDPTSMTTMLETLLSQASNLPARFFLTSRPEPSISKTILSSNLKQAPRSILELHNVEEQFVKADIETYLTVTLAELAPIREHIEQLAEQAGILFIYAATVVRYILAKTPGANPATRLKAVLERTTNKSNRKDREIDQLYKAILEGAFGTDESELEEDEAQLIKSVLWTVVCVREPVTKGTLVALLELDAQQVGAALQPLQSVLHISEGSDIVSTLHASFPEFMLNSRRSGSLSCDERLHSNYLAERCFEIMKGQLRFNICNLKTSYSVDGDVPDLKSRVEAAIRPELFYACIFWVDHLQRSTICEELFDRVYDFLHERLLFWMEVMNLKNLMSNGPKLLLQAQSWLRKQNCRDDIHEFVRDACNFVTRFAANAVCQSTPHIYISLLPLAPKYSMVWKAYWERTRGLLDVEGPMRQQQGALTIWDLGSEVTAMDYSSNNARVALGSYDSNGRGVIHIHDAHIGTKLAQPFQGHGHKDHITSISFSLDGCRVLSGSWDNTLCVWDASTGLLINGPFHLHEHDNRIISVAFSVDSRQILTISEDTISAGGFRNSIRMQKLQRYEPFDHILSCYILNTWSAVFSPDRRLIATSYQNTIRVWDVPRGELLVGPFEGHAGSVTCLAFSPDGTRVISGSSDGTIRVWGARDAMPIAGPFSREGVNYSVTCVSVSPDGNQIVSGTDHDIVRVWDVQTGELSMSALTSHAKDIDSVLFSSDGTRFVSSSSDGMVSLWGLQGSRLALEPKHRAYGTSVVAFSPDGARIVSASRQGTIQIWDVFSGEPLALSHASTITSESGIACLSFSPDGTRIVVGTHGTRASLQVLDACTNKLLAGPLRGHSDSITSVEFSPDGTLIASGSRDSTVRVWSMSGGEPISIYAGHSKAVNSVVFSPDGRRIVSSSDDHTAMTWDGEDMEPFSLVHGSKVISAVFSPDGTHIASCSEGGCVRLWRACDAVMLDTVSPFFNETVKQVGFAPDGKRIICVSEYGTIQIWDPQKHSFDISRPTQGNQRGPADSFAISKDGARIVFARVQSLNNWDGCNRSIWACADFDYYLPPTPVLGPWTINPDGWVVDPHNRLLFWLPQEVHKTFPRPPTTLSIGPEGAISVRWTGLLLGEDWNQCYDPAHAGSLNSP